MGLEDSANLTRWRQRPAALARPALATARRTQAVRSTGRNGFCTKPAVDPFSNSPITSDSVYPLIMITGKSGRETRIAAAASRPSRTGITTSSTTTRT